MSIQMSCRNTENEWVAKETSYRESRTEILNLTGHIRRVEVIRLVNEVVFDDKKGKTKRGRP